MRMVTIGIEETSYPPAVLRSHKRQKKKLNREFCRTNNPLRTYRGYIVTLQLLQTADLKFRVIRRFCENVAPPLSKISN